VADIVLFGLFVGAFLLGYVRGAIRQLLALGAWLVIFIVSAHLRSPIGDWLRTIDARWSENYADMLAFLLVFALLFGIALVFIEFTGATIQVSKTQVIDDLLGGVLMVGVAMLVVASLVFALDTYYGVTQTVATTEIGLITDTYALLEGSAIVDVLRRGLIPGLVSLIGPVLPPDVSGVG
jgi:uncharacterized membrane protein required for colicin V production